MKYDLYKLYDENTILFNERTDELYEILEYVPEIDYGIFNHYKVKNLKTNKEEIMTESYIRQCFLTMDDIINNIEQTLKLIDDCQDKINELMNKKEKFNNQLLNVERKES